MSRESLARTRRYPTPPRVPGLFRRPTPDWRLATWAIDIDHSGHPLISVAIGILILASSWGILRDSTRILLEASPSDMAVEEVGQAMAAVRGVRQVNDLHVWTITSGFPALAAHVLVDRDTDCHATRRELEAMLHERFGLEHTTLQVDHEGGDLLQIET